MESAQEPMNNVPQAAVTEAANNIMAIMQEVAVMGANDSELPSLNRIVEKLEKGELTPQEALSEAHSIQNRKAAYH